MINTRMDYSKHETRQIETEKTGDFEMINTCKHESGFSTFRDWFEAKFDDERCSRLIEYRCRTVISKRPMRASSNGCNPTPL